jgi:hypothetical protein
VSDSTHLTQVPLALSVGWLSKTVTTDPPRYPEHQEWSLEVKLTASRPLHIAVFLDEGFACAWGLRPGPASTDVSVTAIFLPDSWAVSDEVEVIFGWQRLIVSDGLLKRDPRDLVRVVAPSVAVTGELVDIAEIDAHGIRFAILALADSDTERRRRDRWRIKPRFVASLPARVVALASGRQSGISNLADAGDTASTLSR